jgi:hypothetical protein
MLYLIVGLFLITLSLAPLVICPFLIILINFRVVVIIIIIVALLRESHRVRVRITVIELLCQL